ncbi:MAG: M56 family metallopeptidase [Ferruginibacter sp.]
MAHFSYSLFLSLMHSLWQAALLVCLYLLSQLFLKRYDPLSKRNILFGLLATQFFLTLSTFFIYYTGTAFYYLEYIDSNLSGLLVSQPYFESAAPWLTCAYIIILTYKALQLILSWHRFKFTGKAAWIKPSIDLKLFTAVKANEFGIHRKVSLWYSNAINTPITFGFLKPVVLLPVALVNNLSIAETETLIIHELTHIKSNDYFLNWLLIVFENIFFFNPFIKIIVAKIKLEREKNCDTWVLQFNYAALNYAETLLKTARFKTTAAPFLLTAVFKNAELIKRIRFFTEEKNLQFNKKNYSSLAFLPVIGIFILNIFLVNFIKIKNSGTAPRQKINNGNTVANENMNNGLSTSLFPAARLAQPLEEKDNNEPVIKRKINNDQAPVFAKLAGQLEQPVPEELVAEDLAMPVALAEPGDSKEIVLKEENSATGRSLTKVYSMKFENGKWKATLLWTITERRPASDSLPYLRDTTTRFYNQDQ